MIRFNFLLFFAFFAHNIAFSSSNPIFHAEPLSLQLLSLQHPDCSHPSGSIAVSATGGEPGYTYEWNTGANSPTLGGLSGGDYRVVVTDSEGSTAEMNITLTEDFVAPVVDAGPSLSLSCTNSIGTLDGEGPGGPDYRYDWVASDGGHILSGANTLSPGIDHAGTFTLTITNLINGCSAADQTTVTGLHNAPMATATGGTINCLSSSVTLGVVYTTQNTRFGWQGPGGFQSSLQNPVVSTAGNYVFTVTDTLTGCIGKSSAVVTSNLVPPQADATGGGTITCSQTTVALQGTSNIPNPVFQWSGPNGFQSMSANPTVSVPGPYTLVVTNPANGCTASDGLTVLANLTPPNAVAVASGPLTCASPSISLNGSSSTPGASFAWTGPNNFSSSLPTPSVSQPGVYTLTVKDPLNGCTHTATATVTQNIAPPNASASGGVKTCASPNVVLMGSSSTPGAQYLWTGPNGFTSTQQNPSVGVVGSYTLRVTNPQNGCTANAFATVSQNVTPPSVSASSATITCAKPNAQITTTAFPQGLGFYWTGPNNFVSTAQNPLVGVAGYYNVTVTNPANGCTNTTSVYTFENVTKPFAYAGEDKSLNCYFNTILINASFSSNGPNYTYQWTTYDGHILSGANTLYPSVDTAGTYTLKVTNMQNGCMDFDSMIVEQNNAVTANIGQTTPVYCSGGSTGSATVVGGEGSYVYTYRWSNGSTSATANGLSAGVYTVTVTDSEGCSATATASISQLILSANINVTHQTIPGVNNGTANVTGIGGTSPYTFKWSTSATTTSIGSLAPGPYLVTITDARGCTHVATTNVNAANCILTGTISSTNPSCAGTNNGTATLQLTSALNPVVYHWSNEGNTKTISGLAPGTYTVTATDASNCQVVQSVQITAPVVLVASITAQTQVQCPNLADGSLTVGVTGGVKPYSYKWSSGQSSEFISGLGAGTYTVTVTDANNCTTSVVGLVNSPAPITIQVLQKIDVACPETNTGSISISAMGGVAPYQYFWSNGSTLSSIAGLYPGNYSLTVTDANDCPKSISTEILVNDLTPPVLQLKNASVDLDQNGFVSVSASLFDNGSTDNCGIAAWTVSPSTFHCDQVGTHVVTLTATDLSGLTSTATALVTVADQTVPTLLCPGHVSKGACASAIQFNLPQVLDNCAIVPAQLVQLGGLPSGSVFPVGVTHQWFQYTDASGNVGQCSFDVSVGEAVTANLLSQPASCVSTCDGSIALNQTSGGSFSAQWSNGQWGTSLSGLCAGNYVVTVTDDFSCTQTLTAQIAVNDVQAPQLTCPANIVRGYCAGAIQFTQPVVQDNCPVNLSALVQLSGLPSGVAFPIGNTLQVFSYTDGGGNTGQCSFSVEVIGAAAIDVATQAASCAGMCNGTASLSLSGGNAPFNTIWSSGHVGPFANNLCAGAYTYTLTDAAGCAQSAAVSISQPAAMALALDEVAHDAGNSGQGSIQITASGGTQPYAYAWTRNGVLFATTPDLSNLFAGQYALVVTDAHDCTVGSGVIVITNSVGTNDLAHSAMMRLYPNPASQSVTLDLSAFTGELVAVQCFDLGGRVGEVPNPVGQPSQQFDLDVSRLPVGLWLLKVTFDNGQTIVSKLVVER